MVALQEVTAVAGVVADSTNQINEVVSQVIISGLIAYSIEFMKRTPFFPWLRVEQKKLQRWISAGAALVAAAGIHYQYDSIHGALMITGLTIAGIRHGLWEFAKQFVLQQMVYDGIIKESADEVRSSAGGKVGGADRGSGSSGGGGG